MTAKPARNVLAVRKDGNTLARKLYLSRPERNKGVTLEYDDELRVWIKGGDEYFNDTKNQWEPFDAEKIFARNSQAANRRRAQGTDGG